MSLSWSRALAWRMRQQLLDPVGTESVAGVVRRLGAVPAHPDAAAELAVRIVGGVVSGTWSLTGDQVVAAWFAEAGPPAREALAEEVARLATILDRPLQSTVHMA